VVAVVGNLNVIVQGDLENVLSRFELELVAVDGDARHGRAAERMMKLS
jgi:hypothetical protein